ncbi:hypothetical protein WJX79_007610 [Trebouxia sp. C0005]
MPQTIACCPHAIDLYRMARPLMKPMLKEDLALDTLYLSWACQLHRDLLPSSIPRLLQAVASDIVSGGIPGLVLCLGTKVAKEALKSLLSSLRMSSGPHKWPCKSYNMHCHTCPSVWQPVTCQTWSLTFAHSSGCRFLKGCNIWTPCKTQTIPSKDLGPSKA